ncbi:PREDICTED: uncharacterized protein LOC109329179 [Lupinus angustifolius]|uniref:uncharacterized protein LOC109329179 n=1 Tax=Lupinus angustifolius TaxID=3871 RepID=UPI00092E6293|nr:PREDICTED: uncharacterized protein LOC109329179 [Lupinus angustifolius]
MSYSGGWRGYSSRGSACSKSYNRSVRRWHDKDLDKDVDSFISKDKLFFHQHNYKRPGFLDKRLANRFERNQRQHSQSMTSERRWKMWSNKTADGLNNPQRKSDKSVGEVNVVVDVRHKTWFEEEFPLLGDEEKHGGSRSRRALSFHSINSSHCLPTDTSALIFSNSPTSASHEVPSTVGSNRVATMLDQHTISANSCPIAPGLSMAETLVRGPPRSETPPQVSDSTEKLEELARRQSRALIPMIPSKPRNLVTGQKFKTGKQQYQGYSYPPAHSPHGSNTKSDLLKRTSGNSHNATASRELNDDFPLAEKDSANPGGRSSRNITSTVRTTLEKRPTPQSQSRTAFFKNLSRKSSLKNSYSDPFSMPCAAEKSEVVTMNSGDAPSMETEIETSAVNSLTEESNSTITVNNANVSSEVQVLSDNPVLYPEEEKEIAFLRSLGWVESAGEDESLTEEEIRDFVEKVNYSFGTDYI